MRIRQAGEDIQDSWEDAEADADSDAVVSRDTFRSLSIKFEFECNQVVIPKKTASWLFLYVYVCQNFRGRDRT